MEWKPKAWLAAVLSLLANPTGMLYVQRPGWALFYFVLTLLCGVAALILIVLGLPAAGMAIAPASWLVAIACAVHSFRLARRSAPTQRRWYSRWPALIGVIVAQLAFVFLFRSFLWEPFHFPSESMYPTIPKGSYMFIDKRGFGRYGTFGIELLRTDPTARIARGDLIVFRVPQRPDVYYLHRVVALPGERIVYRDHRMTINGRPMPLVPGERDERYQFATETLDGRDVTVAFLPGRSATDYDEIVPDDHYVVFGDSRDNARDSRFVGAIPRDAIVGRVTKVFPPRPARPRE